MKILQTVIITILLNSTIFSSAMADDRDKYNTLLELATEKKVTRVIHKQNKIYEYINNYILDTTDFYPTKNEIELKYGLDSSVWNNESGGFFDFTLNADGKYIEISNSFSHSISGIKKSQFLINSERYGNGIVLNNMNVRYYFPTKTINYIQKVITILNQTNNVTISMIEPTTNNQIWYKPDGNGNFDIYIYDGTNWILKGGVEGNQKIGSIILDETTFSAETTPGVKGMIGYIEKNNGTVLTYVYNGKKWIQKNKKSNSSVFYGYITLNDAMDTDFYESPGGSKIDVKIQIGEGSTFTTPINAGTTINFHKLDNGNIKKSLWISNDNSIIIAKYMEAFYANNSATKGWINNGADKPIAVQKTVTPFGLKWTYMVQNYDEILSIQYPEYIYSGAYAYVKSKNKYMKYVAGSYNHWVSSDNSVYINDSGRADFQIVNGSSLYLSNANDCTLLNCEGTPSLVDNLYKYNYTTNGVIKQLNHLTN